MNIGVIGCGNMASAVVENLSLNKDLNFFTYTPSFTKAHDLALKVNGKAVKNLEDFKAFSIDYWLIGCKPQQLKDLTAKFNPLFKNSKIISMLAATDINTLENAFKSDLIFRIMPNTPIKVNSGVTLSFYSDQVDSKYVEEFNLMFKNSGLIKCSDERELDILTVFSGCGPAYIYLFADTLFQKMISLGFEEDTSKKLLDNLFLGSAKMMKESTHSYSELVDAVTSKAGVTIEAVNEFKKQDLLATTSSAIDQAIFRTEELSREMSN
jgi:pyrroline-5-carboxylate reductase